MEYEAQALKVVQESGIKEIIDQAHFDRRLSIPIKPALWDRLRPAVRTLCGRHFRQMNTPWRSFMLDGVWLERRN